MTHPTYSGVFVAKSGAATSNRPSPRSISMNGAHPVWMLNPSTSSSCGGLRREVIGGGGRDDRAADPPRELARLSDHGRFPS